METVLGYVVQVSSTFFTIAGDAVDFIMANPIALVPICSMVVISGIGVARNLIRGV